MWLFTSIGFFSVVAHRDRSDTMIIRARVGGDLAALRSRHLPDLEIEEHTGTDYRWRAYVSRDEWEHAAAGLAAAIDYPNFKDAVAARQGHDRARRYFEVWQIMLELQAEQD